MGENLHLFFNCEGWVRFGPFRLIQFAASGKIVDENGDILAIQNGEEWQATEKLDKRWMNLRNPIISPTPNLPAEIRNKRYGLAD